MAELSTQTSSIVSKVWGLCNPLRDDGVSYGDYLEQLTYLIFLKMADEYSKPPYNRDSGIPAGCTWQDMRTLKGTELEEKYKTILETLGKQSGLLGNIFIYFHDAIGEIILHLGKIAVAGRAVKEQVNGVAVLLPQRPETVEGEVVRRQLAGDGGRRFPDIHCRAVPVVQEQGSVHEDIFVCGIRFLSG